MTSTQVLEFVALAANAGIETWIDGGWGIDALLGRQTRAHSDLDLVVSNDSLPQLRTLLDSLGFAVSRDWLPTAIAFHHPDGREIDLHPIDRSSDGGGDQVQLDRVSRWHYDPPVTGLIDDVEVRCCALATQVRAHVGYEPDENDYADMRLIRDEFGVVLPAPYDRA